jgi:hypothetical protein
MSVLTGVLRRHVDISGVSGVGDVAEFCEFSDGSVAVRWLGEHPSTAVWGDIRDVEFIHGHKGATEILFDSPRDPETEPTTSTASAWERHDDPEHS